MATKPQNVGRLTPPHGTVWDIARNRDVTTGAGKFITQDLSITTDRVGVWRQWGMVAGWPVDHGEVADQAAMLALHTFEESATTQPLPRYVAPGDSCTRADDAGWRWHCLRGHGAAVSDWERRPLSGALTGLAVTGHTHTLASLTEVVSALSGKQPTLTNATALADITESGGLPRWRGEAWPSSGGSTIGPWASPACQWWFGVESPPLAATGARAASAAAVAAWHDQSRYHRDALQVTAGYRPTCVTDGDLVGIRSTAGTYQGLHLAQLSTVASGVLGDFTLYMLARRGATGSGYALMFGSIESGRITVYGAAEGGGEDLAIIVGSGTTSWPAYTVATSIKLLEVRVRSGVATLYVNGTSIGTGAGGVTVANAAWVPKIGNYAPGTALQGYDVDIFHASLFSGAATETEMDFIRAYLLAQAGL